MNPLLNILSIFLISLGCIIMFTASLALIRFKHIYMRLHASSKAGTGGVLTLLIGVLLRIGFKEITGKIILLAVLILVTGPVLAHAIARAGHLKSGMTAEVPYEDYEQSRKKKVLKKKNESEVG